MKLLPILTVITAIGLFSSVASYAQGKYGPEWDKPERYSQSQINAMNDFVALHLSPSPSKMVYVWRDKKAALLAEGWGLKPDEVGSNEALRVLK